MPFWRNRLSFVSDESWSRQLSWINVGALAGHYQDSHNHIFSNRVRQIIEDLSKTIAFRRLPSTRGEKMGM